MRATWDKLEKNLMQFEVEIASERFDKAVSSAFHRLNQRVTIPGFRRGKASRTLFERHYGKETVIQEAIDSLLSQAYSEALVAHNISPIERPEVELVQAEEGKPFVFKGKVQVIPEVVLGRLAGFGIEKPSEEVTAEQVDQQLEALRNRRAALVMDESGEVKMGSHAVIDFEGFEDGEPFEGGKAENYTLEIGSNSFIPGFEEQLIGARASEEREVRVVFPERYHIEHLAGKEALFKVTIREVKRKELPELTDEFAAEVGSFQTLQELRTDVENRLKETARANAEKEYPNMIIEAIMSDAEIEVPELLVHQRVHHMIDEFQQMLSKQGLSIDDWMSATGKTHEDLHKEFEEPASKHVKRDLVLRAVAKQEGIHITDADLEAEFDQWSSRFTEQEREIRKLRKNDAYRQQVREDLLIQRTIHHLVTLNSSVVR